MGKYGEEAVIDFSDVFEFTALVVFADQTEPGLDVTFFILLDPVLENAYGVIGQTGFGDC